METVIEVKVCNQCSTPFNITDTDRKFYDQVSPIFQWIKYIFPFPLDCPQCRQKERFAFRNERNLYRRTCDLTGVNLISMYRPNVSFPVYKQSVWFWDSWDPKKYSQDFDFEKTFFEQFHSLIQVVPRPHTFNYADERMLNSEYTNCAGDMKNCHLVFGAARNENCYYSTYINDSKSCVDCHFVFKSELCYECIDLVNCFHLSYSRFCQNCSQSTYIKDCLSCHNCIGCVGLKNAEYYILNKKYSKEEYLQKKAELQKENYASLLPELQKLFATFPNKFFHGEQNENVTGDYINSSKNCQYSFDIFNAEDCKYCSWFNDGKSCQDFFAWGEATLCYQVVSGGDNHQHCSFTVASWGCSDCYYIDSCMYCHNCFGCEGLKNQEYCIFNKQYTKQEYEKLAPQIIQYMQKTWEWGKFFPKYLSSFAYNESVAIEYYPMEKDEAIRCGFLWTDYIAPFPKVEKYIPASMLPADIAKIPDDILNWAIECEDTKKPFRITLQELEFYRKYSFPIPKKHPDIRYRQRLALRNPRNLFERKCDSCWIELQTSYYSNSFGPVFCEWCYNKAVY